MHVGQCFRESLHPVTIRDLTIHQPNRRCGHQTQDDWRIQMQRGYKFLGSLCISAALLGSGAVITGAPILATAQDHDDHDRDHDRDAQRVYDRDHRDYHNWDDREDHAYRQWLDEKHEAYREYSRLKHKEQREYWDWRHSHEQHEEHEQH